jgi:DNA polymerase III delta subunit
MIICLTGTNTIRIAEELARIRAKTTADIERYDGTELTENQLADLLSGATLFSSDRFIVIRHLSENAALWERMGQWIERVANDTTLVMIEAKLDKRTKTYKILAGHATMIDAPQWTDRDVHMAAEWVRQAAKKMNIKLSPAQVTNMVNRAQIASEKPGAYVIDQLRLYTALQSLRVLDEVSDESIATVMPPAVGETIFDLLAIAVEGDRSRVYAILEELRATEEPHKVFAMLAGQWTQLVSVAVASGPQAASDLGIHPYVVQKLSGLARQFNRGELRSLTRLCADIDAGMKLSQFDPWDGIERFVFGITLKRRLPS